MGFLNYCGILVVLVAISIFTVPPVIDRFSDKLKGIVPILHRAEPWGFQTHQIPDQTGKTILITGANVGLGYWTAYHLAEKNANVVMACRNMKKGEAARHEILQKFPNAKLELLQLDLSDLQSVKDASGKFLQSHTRLDSLILNAGVMIPPYTMSKQNLELQFAVNHLGHFYLTTLLLPLVERAAPATIAVVSSAAHYVANQVWTDAKSLNDEAKYSKMGHYCNSKLANVLFTQELHSRLRKRGIDNVFVNAIHPGAVKTDIVRHMGLPKFMSDISDWLTDKGFGMWRPEDASLTQLYTAVSPQIFSEKISGKYFHPIARETTPSDASKNLENQKKLWEWSEKLIAKFEEGKPQKF